MTDNEKLAREIATRIDAGYSKTWTEIWRDDIQDCVFDGALAALNHQQRTIDELKGYEKSWLEAEADTIRLERKNKTLQAQLDEARETLKQIKLLFPYTRIKAMCEQALSNTDKGEG